MTSSPFLPRLLLIYGVCIPVAIFVGYFLATPLDLVPFVIFALLVMLLGIPLLMRWHHPLLVFSWNAAMIVIVLPGQPYLWVPMAGVSFLFGLLDRILSKRETFMNVASVVWPLVLLALIIIFTAKTTGGVGFRSFGSTSYGGKRYVVMLAAILGFFAFVGRGVPIHLAPRYAALFFLSSVTAMLSNLAFAGGPALYFLYYVFPVDYALTQAGATFAVTGNPVMRLTGLSVAAVGFFCFMLVRYGILGVLDFSKPWRLLIVLAVTFVSLLGGFRSFAIVLGLLLLFQFFLEGLHTTKYLPVGIITAVLALSLLLPFASELPRAVQRSLSFIPFIQMDADTRRDADGSVDWRFRMWQALVPEVPKYLWIGKGFAINPTDLYLTEDGVKKGLRSDIEPALITGTYHNGPLTLLIAFGIPGALAFGLFLIGAGRALYRNYRYSPTALRSINTFLLSYFLARAVYFVLFYGQIAEDLYLFTGVTGLSICLNGGVRSEGPVADQLAPELVAVGQPA